MTAIPGYYSTFARTLPVRTQVLIPGEVTVYGVSVNAGRGEAYYLPRSVLNYGAVARLDDGIEDPFDAYRRIGELKADNERLASENAALRLERGEAESVSVVRKLRADLRSVTRERDRLAKILAVERGDPEQAPPGWERVRLSGTTMDAEALNIVWRRGPVVVGYRVYRSGWECTVQGASLQSGGMTALEAMENADRIWSQP